MHSKSGFSLIELLIIVTILAVIAAIAIPFGSNFLKAHRAKSAFQEFYGDLQEARMNSLAKRDTPYGIRFLSSGAYQIFEFHDGDGDGIYKADHSEAANPSDRALPEGVAVYWGDSTDPSTKEPLLFNRYGLAIDPSGAIANRTYVVRAAGGGTEKCVAIDVVRMMEGVWDGSNCE